MTISNSHLHAQAPAAAPLPSPPARGASCRRLSTVLCAGVLALGLAGCGGGGGGQKSGPTDAETVQSAIEIAWSAVEALTATSPPAQLQAAEDAVEAAKRAVADAGALSDEVKDAHETTISVIEGNLETARESITMAQGDEVAKLATALAGDDRIGAVAATVEHGAAPTMRGTIPGTPATTVTDLQTTAIPGSEVTALGWSGAIYTASDEAAGTTDEVVFHTDIEALGTQPFSGEMGKYGAAHGIDADGNLEIRSATDATLIASPDFPTGPGIVTHPAGAGGVAEVAGTFDGAPGTYVCIPGMDNGCTSSVRSGGGIALAGGGGWKFVPDEGAMVAKPDTEYRYFGWWLRRAADSYSVGAFHGSVGGNVQDFRNLHQLQGTATYSGPAAGKFAINPPAGAAEVGEFTASVTLEVDFGDDFAPGTVTGAVDGFVVSGAAMPWSVDLRSAAIGREGVITASGAHTAHTVWSIDGEQAAATEFVPTWSGKLHDVDETQLPHVATGAFESAYGDLGRMIGAFGATLEQP